MDRDRSYEKEELLDNIDKQEDNTEEKEEYLETLITYLLTQDEDLSQALEKESVKNKENFILYQFLNELNNYNHNIQTYGNYNQLKTDYINNIQTIKTLLNREDMSLEEFIEYMERIIPESTINKGLLIVDEDHLSMTCHKKKVNLHQKVSFLSDYFKYSIEIKDPYHITISTPLLKLIHFNIVFDDYYLTFELKEANNEEFIYEVELPYLPLGEYSYSLIAKDEKLNR